MPANRTTGADEEFQVPPIATSPITGMQGSASWGGLNKFNTGSRHVISDVEADELINWLPQLSAFQQVPSPSGVISTLPGGSVIWAYTDILNGILYTWILSSNGHIYQMTVTGVFSDLGGGFSAACDIANWQASAMMITDPNVGGGTIYSWNGSVLTTVFTSQPAEHIAVYSNRVWLSHNLTLTWTNANTNNSFAGDSGTYTITDGRCANPIIAMRDFNGSLYLFGSNWIKTVYGLQPVVVSGVTTLSFQQPTLESQIGPINKWSIVEYGGMLFFANVFGFWNLTGAFPTKISAALDGFFENVDLSASSFSAAYGVVHNVPCILFAVRWSVDGNYTVFGYTVNQQWFRIVPVTGQSGPGIVKWITGSVSSAVTNNLPITYYSDGTNFYNLFGGTAAVTSQLNTKIFDFMSKLSVDWFTNVALQLIISQPATLTLAELNASGTVCGPGQPAAPSTITYGFTIGDWVNNAGVVGKWINNAGTTGDWVSTMTTMMILAQFVVPFQERALGLNITLVSRAAVFQAIVISYRRMLQSKG